MSLVIRPLAAGEERLFDSLPAVELLRTAPLHAQYSLDLPSGWRDDPAVLAAANAPLDAAVAAGFTPLVWRHGYRWTPPCGVPARTGRLVYRPEPDDAVILDVFRRVNQGSLDAHARRTIAKSGPDAAAQQRGRGYAYDLLVEATHLLVAEGGDRIGADTDTTNTPMVKTFAKAGYPIVRQRVDLI